MKILLIFPPPASPVSPYLSVPVLAGQLKNAGYDVSCLDLSVEFFHYILNSGFLLRSYKKAKDKLIGLNNILNEKKIKDLWYKQAAIKKRIIEEKLKNEKENLRIIADIDKNAADYKNKEIFYDIEKMETTVKEIYEAFDIAMLPYAPAFCRFNVYKNPVINTNYNGIKLQTGDKENNIFYDFFTEKIKEHKINEYDLICISCPNETQIIPSLTLSRILKEKSEAKIAIGGNIISRIDDKLKKMPEAFDIFYDYIMIGLGENSIISLADYISKRKNNNPENIKGLIYKKDGKIYCKKPDLDYDINKSAPLYLEGFDFDKYFTPDIIMPVQSSKGCYWGKCTFCGLHYPPKKYTVKKPEKVVDELEFLNKNYNIKYFEFIDESIHPKYLSKLADEIIKRNLDIKYVCCARIESRLYTEALCQKLYKSGLHLVQFGFESASERLYSLLNKGIKFKNRLKSVEMFSKAGIWTYLYAIIGYPTETEEEAIQTLSCAKKHKDIIDTLFIHCFWLDKQAPAYKKAKKLGITKVEENKHNEFSQKCNFFVSQGMSQDTVNKLSSLNLEENIMKKYIFFAPDEYFFLYVLHHGKPYMKNFFDTLQTE